MEPVIGIDPHLDSFSLCAADPVGRPIEIATLGNTPSGVKAGDMGGRCSGTWWTVQGRVMVRMWWWR